MSEHNSLRRINKACKAGTARVLSFILSLIMSCMLILSMPGMAVCLTVAAETLESGVEEAPEDNTANNSQNGSTPAGDVAVEIWEPGQSRPESAEESADEDTDSTDSGVSDTDSTASAAVDAGLNGNAGTTGDAGLNGNTGTTGDSGTQTAAPAVTAAPANSQANVVWQNDLPEELFANVRITYNTVGDPQTDASAANAGSASGNASAGSSGTASGMPFSTDTDSDKNKDSSKTYASGDIPVGNNPVDFVLILDGSDSMLHSDPDALYISAARMFIDMLPSENARLAIVGFGPDYGEEAYRGIQFEPEESYRNRQVKVYYDLQSIADQDSKQIAKEAVSRSKQETNDFPGLTYTPIGYAMQTANAILKEGGSAPENAAIILLSDGRVSGQADGYNDALDYRSIDEASDFADSNGWPIYCLELNFDGMNDSTHWRGKIGHHQMRENIPERAETEPIALNDPDEAELAFTAIFARFFEATETMTMESDTIEGGKASMDFTVDEMVAETNITLTGPIAEVESVEFILPDGTSEMYNVSDGNVDNLERKLVFEDRYISAKLIMPPSGGWTVCVYGTDGVRIGLYAVSIRELILLLTDNLPPVEDEEAAEGEAAGEGQAAGEGVTASGAENGAENASANQTASASENASPNEAAAGSTPIWAQTTGTTLSTATQAEGATSGTATQASQNEAAAGSTPIWAQAAGTSLSTATQAEGGASGTAAQASGTNSTSSEESQTAIWQKYLAPVDVEAAELPENNVATAGSSFAATDGTAASANNTTAGTEGTAASAGNASAGASDTAKAPLWQQYTSSGSAGTAGGTSAASGDATAATGGTSVTTDTAGTSAAPLWQQYTSSGSAQAETVVDTAPTGTTGGTSAVSGDATAATVGTSATTDTTGTSAAPLWQQYTSSGSAQAETVVDTAADGTAGISTGADGNVASGNQAAGSVAGDGNIAAAGTAGNGAGTLADAAAGIAENGTVENGTDESAQVQGGVTANGGTAGRSLTPGTTVEFEASFSYRGKPYTTDAVYQRIPAKIKIMHDGLEAAVIPMEASGSIYTASYTFEEAGSYSVHATAEHEAFRLGERNSDALLYAVVVPEEPVVEEPEPPVEEPEEEPVEEKAEHSIMFTSLTGAAPDANSAKLSEQLYLKRIGPPNFLMNMAGIEPKDTVTINYSDYFADPENPELEGVTFTCTDMLGSTAGIGITEQDEKHATITATDKGSAVFLVTATDTNGETPVQKTIQIEVNASKAWSEILNQYKIYAIIALAAVVGLIVALVFFIRSRL